MAKDPARTAVRSSSRRRWRRRRDADRIEGIVRVDRKTKDLIPRLRPGEIAVIDHEDLDRVSAEGLVERGVAVVVNAKASITGRYPNTGPAILARAGVPLVDRAGSMRSTATGKSSRRGSCSKATNSIAS
jgi:uncharacterized membrane-anchored protein